MHAAHQTSSPVQAPKKLGEFGFAGDDVIVPFEVDALDVRGRAVQLGPILDSILGRHDYPDPVARLLAEAVLVTVLLGTSLKFEGKFILQTRTDGPVDMLVVDFATPQAVRAYARFDAERVRAAVSAHGATPEALLGRGVLALTIDQGAHTQRYQGIVELDGVSLEEAARRYFRQSEQIPTEVKLGVAKQVLAGGEEVWRAGGLLAQFLPAAPERRRMPDLPGGDGDPNGEAELADDAWRELLALMETVEPAELIDPTVGAERLLFRLFHEHGARVFPGVQVLDRCTCSRERIAGVLQGFTAQEIADSVENGTIRVNCEFCSQEYRFDPAEFAPAR